MLDLLRILYHSASGLVNAHFLHKILFCMYEITKKCFKKRIGILYIQKNLLNKSEYAFKTGEINKNEYNKE